MNETNPENSKRKSTVDYWDENWRRASHDHEEQSLHKRDNFVWRRIDRALSKCLGNEDNSGRSLIEIGAGASNWLPYLHSRFGFDVAGLDYSEIGCERARDILRKTSTPGNIHLADMFEPPSELLGTFDVVASFGVVEHFEDTTAAMRACAALAKPTGLIVTLIPNMSGLHGWLYRVFDNAVYKTHVPLTLANLMDAHRRAGLDIVLGEHLVGLPGVIDANRAEPVLIRRLLRQSVHQLSRVYWRLEDNGLGVPENALTSPYMICAARKNVPSSSADGQSQI